VDAPGDTDADAFELLVRVLGAHGLEGFGDLHGSAFGVGGQRNGLAGEEASVEVDDG
jgi:hypothetical protein